MDKDKPITFTLRLHDAAERLDPNKSTVWAVATVKREDLALSTAEFMERYAAPAIEKMLADLKAAPAAS